MCPTNGPYPATRPRPATPDLYFPWPYTLTATNAHWFDSALIAAGLELRYNVRSQRQQYRRVPFLEDMGKVGWNTLSGWQDWTDTISTNLRAELATKDAAFLFGGPRVEDTWLSSLEMAEKPFEAAVKLVCARNAVDPFVEYLENETPVWDGMPRLSAWLWHCFDVAEDSCDLVDWASEFVFLGAVQRAMQTGPVS